MKFTYLFIDVATIFVPLVFSFHPRLQFYRQWKAFWLANGLVSSLFIVWDVLYTHWGVWGFNPRYLSGLYFFNLPVEEVLFFVCIPYACVFSYHCLCLFRWPEMPHSEKITLGISVILLVLGLQHIGQLYTAATFLLLSAFLLYLHYFARPAWLGRFYSIWLVLLLPFFVVNGVLTGTGLEEPIVWYNNNENLGLRLLTIPVEDVFYGMLLVMLNIYLYEKWKK